MSAHETLIWRFVIDAVISACILAVFVAACLGRRRR